MTNLSFKSSDDLKINADKIFKEQKTRILSVIPNGEVHHIGRKKQIFFKD